MSAKIASAKKNGDEAPDGAINGTVGKQDGVALTAEEEGEEGEESDEYDEYDEEEEDGDYEEGRRLVGDEDDEEYEGEEEGAKGKRGNSLTALLIGNPNAPVQEHDNEEEEEEDDEYSDDMEPPTPTTKKRTIDEVGVEDEPQGAKKIKA